MATIEENINRVIADFDSIATVLNDNGVETKNLTTSQYAEQINEILNTGGTTITLEDADDGVIITATNRNGDTTTATIDNGQEGFSPIITENANNDDVNYKLDIETKEGIFTTPNLKGENGNGSIIVDENLDTTSENPIKNKTVAIKFNEIEQQLEEINNSAPFTYYIKIKGTIGDSTEYLTYISQSDLQQYIDTGNQVVLYGDWTIDSVEANEGAINKFQNFSFYPDSQITSSSNISDIFDDLVYCSGDEVLGETYEILYEWNDFKKQSTITFNSIDEMCKSKGITEDELDGSNKVESIMSVLDYNEELILTHYLLSKLNIDENNYGTNIISKIIFHKSEEYGSIIAILENGIMLVKEIDLNDSSNNTNWNSLGLNENENEAIIYTSLELFNKAKETSIELEENVDNYYKIRDELENKETFKITSTNGKYWNIEDKDLSVLYITSGCSFAVANNNKVLYIRIDNASVWNEIKVLDFSIDTELNENSKNPVQNQVITNAIKFYKNIYRGRQDLNQKSPDIEISNISGTDSTPEVINALDMGEIYISSNDYADTYGIDTTKYGRTIAELKIVKGSSSDASVTAFMEDGNILYRQYQFGVLNDWFCLNEKPEEVDLTGYAKLDDGITGTDTTWSSEKITSELGSKTYTTLDELGLTADATVEDAVSVLKNGESFLAPVNTFTNYETIFPNKVPNDQWNKVHIVKGTSLANSHIRCFSQDGTSEYLANINDTSIVGWNELSGDSSITLTQEEYDALTDEEKNNGTTYYISDADTDLTIDEEVNEESVNLVTNKAVATAIKEQINDTQATADKTYSSVKIESLINDTTYTPDMYDRNANGDMPVVPFDRLANNMFLIQNQALIKEGETYDEDYVGGWVYTSANDVLTKEMFNKIKCIVAIPGVLRIGIMNERLWDANPRYSTCLVKWLVSDFVAYTGLKEYDIEDTILEEGQYLFIECRAGESAWYYNSSTEDVKIGDVTYPASSCTSGLNVADKLDSTTNNVVFKSQSVTSTSAKTYFGNGQYNVGSKYRTNFLDRHCTSTARTAPKPQDQSLYQGGLNVGLYRRTKYSDTRFCKCIENGMNISWVGDDSVTKIYAAIGQEEIVGKSVYAFKLDVNTPGNLTIYHLKGKSLDTIEIIDKHTHYVRAKGLQTIHLPFDIKLESEDEYIGFGGLHFKSTSDNIVRHSCKWQYMAGDQTTGSCGWMNTIGKTGFYSIGVSMTSYPEIFTSFETNGSYLNIELICRGEKRSPLEDKYISFTGDSITTFANFVTTQAGYPEGNSAGDNAYYYPASGKVINNVDATWWGILARDNRMQILRNDAWSGSRVSSTTGSTDTKCLCGTERRYYLRNTYEPTTATTYPFGIPEIVVNMIGTNDLSGNVELGAEMFKGVTGAEDEYKTILSAYSLMCRRFAAEYNKNGAKVVHFIIPRGSDWGYTNSNEVTIADLSLAFERIAKAWGQYFIPLSYFTGFNPAQYKKNTCPTASVHRNFRGTEFTSADGLHPNVVGMEILADGVDRFLKEIV